MSAALFVTSAACQGGTRNQVLDARHCGASENVAAEKHYMPGDTIPDEVVKERGASTFFKEMAISDSVFAVMKGKSYGANCTVPRKNLRYLTCLHVTADGCTIVGEMVLNVSISKKVLGILHQLYDARYPIERMRLVDNYDADDQQSMTDNNSTGFNFRYVSGSKKVSKHGLGLAVDINPLYNPCRRTTRSGQVKVEPIAGTPYIKRDSTFAYKMTRDDLCCRLFREAGFRWGGDWRTVKDYQHFEMP